MDRANGRVFSQWQSPGGHDQLHHFVAAGAWDAAPFEAELLVQADQQDRELPDACLDNLAYGEVPVVVDLRLFLPESWTSDPKWPSRELIGSGPPACAS